MSTREYTDKLLEMIDDGLISAKTVINESLSYMSEDDVTDMINHNGWNDDLDFDIFERTGEVRKNTNMLLEWVEDSIIKEEDVVLACLKYMSEDEVKDMALSCDWIEEYEKEEEIRVLFKKPGEPAQEMYIENTLESKQALVGGSIETLEIEKGIDLILNEEGKILGLLPNLETTTDVIVGDIIIAGVNYDSGEFISLTQEQIETMSEWINLTSIDDPENYVYSFLGHQL